MAEAGSIMKSTIENILRLYEDSASLLLDADELMSRSGYSSLKGTGVECGSSRMLSSPRWWLMQQATRYYVSPQDPSVAKAIGVVYLDGNLRAIEPQLVLATMKGKSHESESEVDPSWVLWDAWKSLADVSPNVLHSFGEVKAISTGKILCLPLDSVTGAQALEELAIKPLIEMNWE